MFGKANKFNVLQTSIIIHNLNNEVFINTNIINRCMAGEFMSIHYYGYGCLDNVLLLDFQNQASVSVKRGYIWQEKSCISSTVMYLAYILFY